MKNDRFLIGIVIGILILVIVAIGVVLSRNQTEAYVADDTPAGVVHNYFLAVQRQDYDKAYSYLSGEIKAKPDLNDFILTVENYGGRPETALKIDDTTINDGRAQVRVAITTYTGGSLFDRGSYTTQDTVHLRTNPAGEWKILQFPYPYWGYDWNNPADID